MPLTPKGYTTKQEIEDVLFADLDASYDTALDDLIAKAEAYVDSATRRRFDSVAGTRKIFVPEPNRDVLTIPDTVSASSIEVNPYHHPAYDLGTEDYDWRLEGGREGGPSTRLRLLHTNRPRIKFTNVRFPHPAEVTITGTFGWASVPGDIRHATALLVVDATKRWREGKAGDVASVTMGEFAVTYDIGRSAIRVPDWRRLIRPYVRMRVAA